MVRATGRPKLAISVTDGMSVVITTVGNEAVTSGAMRENRSIMVWGWGCLTCKAVNKYFKNGLLILIMLSRQEVAGNGNRVNCTVFYGFIFNAHYCTISAHQRVVCDCRAVQNAAHVHGIRDSHVRNDTRWLVGNH